MGRLLEFIDAKPGWTIIILLTLIIVIIIEMVFFFRKEKFDVKNNIDCYAHAKALDPMVAHEILGLNMAQGLSPDAISKDPKRDQYDKYLDINYGIGPYVKDVTTNPDFVDDYSDPDPNFVDEYSVPDSKPPLTPVQKKDNGSTVDMSNSDSS